MQHLQKPLALVKIEVNELGLSTNKKLIPALECYSIGLTLTPVLLVQKSEEYCFNV